jgi:hypothetical protein
MFPDRQDKDNVMMRTAFMLLLLFLTLPAQAQMYKWVDANGHVQYSDTPPPGTKAQQIKNKVGVVSGPADSAAAGKTGDADKSATPVPRTAAEQEQAFRKRRSDADKAQKEQEQKIAEGQQKEDNCRRARASVAGLQTGRQSKTNEKGERYYLDDNQIQQELAYAQNSVAQYCN